MRAGALDRRIEFYSRTLTKNTVGEEVVTYTTKVKEVWAKAIPTRASEKFQANRDLLDRTTVFITRHDSTLNDTTHRIVYEGLNWNILGIEELGRERGFEILAQQVK